MSSNLIIEHGVPDRVDYYYSFNAEPGTVRLTFDVKAAPTASMSGFDYVILDANATRLASGSLDPIRGESRRIVATFDVDGPGPHQLLLKVTVTEFVATYRILLGGSVSIPSVPEGGKP